MNKKETLSRRSFLSNVAVIGATNVFGAGTLLTACSGKKSDLYTPLRPPNEYEMGHDNHAWTNLEFVKLLTQSIMWVK